MPLIIPVAPFESVPPSPLTSAGSSARARSSAGSNHFAKSCPAAYVLTPCTTRSSRCGTLPAKFTASPMRGGTTSTTTQPTITTSVNITAPATTPRGSARPRGSRIRSIARTAGNSA